MLAELKIEKFAIIDHLHLSFSPGLNILSGETGTGKSIIVGALNLVLGVRASQDVIRTSEEEASVEASFEIGRNETIRELLASFGVDGGGSLVLSRVVTRSGRNKIFVNGHLGTLAMLSRLGEELINISGQREHQIFMEPERQLDLLDDYGGLSALRKKVEGGVSRYLKILQEVATLKEQEKEKAQKSELLSFQMKEIEDAGLREGEEDELSAEKRTLSHAERLFELSHHVHESLYIKRGSALEQLKGSLKELKEAGGLDPCLAPLASDLESVTFQAEDIALSVGQYAQKVRFDPERLEHIDLRLSELSKLKRKYGEPVREILQRKNAIEKELEETASCEDRLNELEEERLTCEQHLSGLVGELTRGRKEASLKLIPLVEDELKSLGMKGTRFSVTFSPLGEAGGTVALGDLWVGARGGEHVEFLFSPNPGESLRPLFKIASGGELSRVILALKRIVAKKDEIGTLIFDEVDTGIGGATAEVIGKKIQEISKLHQVLCITHLPQIACFADTHYCITKKTRKGRTLTAVDRLSDEGRIEEIARMLAGIRVTPKARAHAVEMIRNTRGG
jgi:DNA repair protein RecN (Recombination protein N)